jgi:hypothetical protein
MDPSLQQLLDRLENLSEEFREVREGVRKAMDIAERDPEMALTRTRKVLELVVREVYQRRLAEPPGTRPLENLIQRLVKDGYFPDRLDAYATTVRKLGNVGTHTFGEKVTAADVHRSLTQLLPILEWYFEVERPDALVRPKTIADPQAGVAAPSTASAPLKTEPALAESSTGNSQRPPASALEMASGVLEGGTYELRKDRIVLGRNPDSDIVLNSPIVARYHCQLVRSREGYLAEDLQSCNGTYVNGVCIHGRVLLHNNDRLHVGPYVLIYHTRPPSELGPLLSKAVRPIQG